MVCVAIQGWNLAGAFPMSFHAQLRYGLAIRRWSPVADHRADRAGAAAVWHRWRDGRLGESGRGSALASYADADGGKCVQPCLCAAALACTSLLLFVLGGWECGFDIRLTPVFHRSASEGFSDAVSDGGGLSAAGSGISALSISNAGTQGFPVFYASTKCLSPGVSHPIHPTPMIGGS